MRRIRWLILLLIPAALAVAINGQAWSGQPPRPNLERFAFALLGDIPYNPFEEVAFLRLIERVNRENVVFAVHDGDIKSGSAPCSDEAFLHVRALFQRFIPPLIYVPGDNEWTDCHRKAAGSFDPIERLGKLRAIFFQGDESLGQRKLKLGRQSQNPAFAQFSENVSWTYGNVLFVGLNIPGSNNNLGRTLEGDAEYRERNAANLAWLKEKFRQAKAQSLGGLMLIIQANPGFDEKPEKRTGYNDFLAALLEETLAFDRPVVLVHGDTHYFRIDKPLRHPRTGLQIPHFTRVETFGSPDVHWVYAEVDPQEPNLFTFKPRMVTGK